MIQGDQRFISDYFAYYRQQFSQIGNLPELLEFYAICQAVKKRGNKLIFAGNGASASISSHAATDFTQHAGVRSICFNDHNLLTCFGNDYGYEHWVARALEFYADDGDVVVLISSSGKSPNVVNGASFAAERGLSVITFTGFSPDNPLHRFGRPGVWVDSSAYNVVESLHLLMILTVSNALRHSLGPEEFMSEHLKAHESALFLPDYSEQLRELVQLCRRSNDGGNKLIFAGNGGSSSIASHAAVDFTKQSGTRVIALNDHNLNSAFSNDYGHDQCLARAVASYADEGDTLVLLSCSGQSQNVLNAAETANEMGLSVVTFTGFGSSNRLGAMGKLNFWVDSQNYNVIEAVHMILIFCVGDLLAGEPIYRGASDL